MTKGFAADTEIAGAMLAGGVTGLADSRLSHLKKLRERFSAVPLMSLRQPMLAEMADLAALDVFALISDARALPPFAAAARKTGRVQSVVLMVEVGEGREGIDPAHLPETAESVRSTEGLRLAGLAVNTGCRGGRKPDHSAMRTLDDLCGRLSNRSSGERQSLEIVSAGNSSCWRMMEAGELARSANHLRFGEAILLGRETAAGEKIEGARQDAFTVRAEIIEVADKLGQQRLVVAIGCREAGAGTLTPLDGRLNLERLTSDHAVLTAPSDYPATYGQIVDFLPSYFALQSLTTSPHVGTDYISL